ncbi:MAG: heavy metal translocating P-type ATPase [Pseudomonadota bacterium]
MAERSPTTLSLTGMSCASCVGRVENALHQIPGLKDVSVNLATETAHFDADKPKDVAHAAATLRSLGYPARRTTGTLKVDAMSCASCTGRVEKLLADLPGVMSASVNLATGQAQLDYLEGMPLLDTAARTLTEAGYPARPLARSDSVDRSARLKREAQLQRARALWAALLALPVFLLEMGGHLVPAFHHWVMATLGQQTAWSLQFVLTTAVLAGPGREFFARGVPALLRRAPDMNSLVAVGTGAAWIFSTVATFAPHILPDAQRAVYFEAAAVIVVLILLGRWMEARAKGLTGAAIAALVQLQPRLATVWRKGEYRKIPIEELAVGDRVRLHPGERVPADGEVTENASMVDESMLTGEALPVAKTPGDAITGGTVNGAGSLTLRVTRVGSDTTLAQIVAMVEEAQGSKLPIQNLVDRVTLWFVPAVLGVALVTVAVWLLFGPDPALSMALISGVSVLIIACPCAMGLATPTSIMVGTGRAAELGVLFRRGNALQHLSEIDLIAFDKTGTLTAGKPEVVAVVTSDPRGSDEILRLAASAEALSEHPVAGSIVSAAKSAGLACQRANGFRSVTGQGVFAEIDELMVHVGSARFLQAEGIATDALAQAEERIAAAGQTPLLVAVDETVCAVIAVADAAKPSGAKTIAGLKARGVEVAMITGDKQATAQAIARDLGIETVISEVMPAGKLQTIARWQNAGRRVAFVGDGINDAPALAQADVGVALGSGTDVAIESADVVLMSGDPVGVLRAVEISCLTLRNIRQNLGWAFGYNTALIPVAAGALYPLFGLLFSPVFAAAAMALSSVSVLSNALRLRRIRLPDAGTATAGPATVGHAVGARI